MGAGDGRNVLVVLVKVFLLPEAFSFGLMTPSDWVASVLAG